MNPGDLIKHKRRSDILGVIIKTFKGKKETLVTVLFSSGTKKMCTAPLKMLEDNWEVISEI